MKSDVTQIAAVIDHPLPDGVYPGVWNGYTVTVVIDGVHYKLTTALGLGMTSPPCEVTVRDGVATVEAI